MFFAPFSKKEPGAPGAVQAPAQYRGKGETADTQGKQNGRPGSADGGKGVRNAFPICAEDHQSRHGADDNGVQKNLHDAQQDTGRRGKLPFLDKGPQEQGADDQQAEDPQEIQVPVQLRIQDVQTLGFQVGEHQQKGQPIHMGFLSQRCVYMARTRAATS